MFQKQSASTDDHPIYLFYEGGCWWFGNQVVWCYTPQTIFPPPEEGCQLPGEPVMKIGLRVQPDTGSTISEKIEDLED